MRPTQKRPHPYLAALAGILFALSLAGPATAERTVTLVAVGDILLDRGVGEKMEREGVDYPFRAVTGILKGADIAVGNLECPLSEAGIKVKKPFSFRAKPTAAQRTRVPHHLLDLAEPSERFTVARFQEAARDVLARVRRPLLVGGSGLYFRAVVDDLSFPPEDPDVRGALESEAMTIGVARLYERLLTSDPVAAAKIEPGNVRRTIRALTLAWRSLTPPARGAPATYMASRTAPNRVS
jgi:hypothetical protein